MNHTLTNIRTETEVSSFLLSLSKAIVERRKHLGLSQLELGRRIGGASRTYISDIETGYRNRNNITLESLYRIAKALEWTPQELIQEAATKEAEPHSAKSQEEMS